MYNGEHSVIFGPTDGSAGMHTWEDWFLIPTSRPTMSMPGAQNKFVEIPGMNGSYDISDYLTPDVTYTDRSGSFEFVVDNDHADWLTIYRSIAAYLHGQRLRMILTDDLEWYYEGRFTLDEWKSEQARSKISISYRVAPFKFSIYADFTDNILWDPFCFERDSDWSALYHVELSNETRTYDLEAYGIRNQIRARLVSGGPITASFGSITATLDTPNAEVALGQSSRIGMTSLTLSGSGVVDIGWQKLSM